MVLATIPLLCTFGGIRELWDRVEVVSSTSTEKNISSRIQVARAATR